MAITQKCSLHFADKKKRLLLFLLTILHTVTMITALLQ